ncbi:MAG: radical SAM protein [Deltaproteobacteria bacterium]|nr:MAG: radical SAM protein [Deltaproteobacteria bacterium]
MPKIARHILDKCRQCGACLELVACPGAEEDICIGCGACALICPNQAIEMIDEKREGKIKIEIDGREAVVSCRISLKEALEEAGYTYADLPEESGLYAPCNCGGCLSCAVDVDGITMPSCITAVAEGMKIRTRFSPGHVPKRVVFGFVGHPSGGVGTPWQLRKDPKKVIEIICYTSGCNFRCTQCQNWYIAFSGKGKPLTPGQAAARAVETKSQFSDVERFAVSGGEATLNRSWLISFIKELKKINPGKNFHFHVDTNGSLLTRDYIDELVDAGMTDIGVDIKSLHIDTFMKITGLKESNLARKYKENAWMAVKYLVREYGKKVFTGIGIPYNKDLISIEEIRDLGKKIYDEIDSDIQVSVNDYQPSFRSRISRTSSKEMRTIHSVLKDTKLKRVVCQSSEGFICP